MRSHRAKEKPPRGRVLRGGSSSNRTKATLAPLFLAWYALAAVLQSDNPITRPTSEQEKILETLHRTLERNAANTKVFADGIRGITLQQVPDAYRGFTKSIERLLGVKTHIVRAEEGRRTVGFNGVHMGGRKPQFMYHSSDVPIV